MIEKTLQDIMNAIQKKTDLNLQTTTLHSPIGTIVVIWQLNMNIMSSRFQPHHRSVIKALNFQNEK
jgi:hypothetical protein